jgi:hypothetical protein
MNINSIRTFWRDPAYRWKHYAHMKRPAGRKGSSLMPLSEKNETDNSKSENRLIYKEIPTG